MLPADAKLTQRPAEIPAWQDMSIEQKRLFERQMETFAGFAEHTDHEVGRLVAPLAAPCDARMGTVHVRVEACYAAQGSICDVCAERCPVRPKAIRVSMGAAPELDLGLCTGCGVCAWLCPAHAIDVQPRVPARTDDLSSARARQSSPPP